MPIGIDQFKEAQRPLKERILEVLEEHSDSAFTLFELVADIEGWDPKTVPLLLLVEKQSSPEGTWHRFNDALSQLQSEGEISAVEVRGDTYYAVIKKP